MIKVLSIIEPWATLIKEKKKYIETRTWKTSYRGELFIHASKKKININDEHITDLLDLIPNVEMGYGKIICRCKLVDCIYIDENFKEEISKNKQEYLCGDFNIGRYAWILEEVVPLEKPIEAKGQLNIWNYDI